VTNPEMIQMCFANEELGIARQFLEGVCRIQSSTRQWWRRQFQTSIKSVLLSLINGNYSGSRYAVSNIRNNIITEAL
jgi:hypothetical protein